MGLLIDWRVEIAWCVAIFQGLALLYCFVRNSTNDKRNVLGQLPLLAQQLVQAILWNHIPPYKEAGFPVKGGFTLKDPEDTPFTCSDTNKQLSLVVACAVHALPCCLAVKAWLGMGAVKATHVLNLGQLKCLLNGGHLVTRGSVGGQPIHQEYMNSLSSLANRTGCWAVGWPVATAVLMYTGRWQHVCTTEGPDGLQQWPWLMVPTQEYFASTFHPGLFQWSMWLTLLYLVICGIRRDLNYDSAGLISSITTPILAIYSMYVMGDQWCSVWCTMMSLSSGLLLIAPMTQKAISDYRYKNNNWNQSLGGMQICEEVQLYDGDTQVECCEPAPSVAQYVESRLPPRLLEQLNPSRESWVVVHPEGIAWRASPNFDDRITDMGGPLAHTVASLAFRGGVAVICGYTVQGQDGLQYVRDESGDFFLPVLTANGQRLMYPCDNDEELHADDDHRDNDLSLDDEQQPLVGSNLLERGSQSTRGVPGLNV